MSKLFEQINYELKQAMKEKSEMLISTLRLLISAIHNKEITLRQGGQAELTDEQILEVIASEIKKRKDAAQTYEQGGRPELADKEKKEIEILNKYLPEQLSDEDLENIAKQVITASGQVSAKDFGKIMGEVMRQAKGKADGGRVSQVVKKLLGQ